MTLTADDHALASGSVCAACERTTLEAFYDAGAVPAHSCVLLPEAAEATEYPMGRVLLAVCRACGFVQNVAFNPSLIDYSQDCEESQAFSPEFTRFARSVAERLVAEHDLVGGTVLEVGCGKGDFLSLLTELGVARGVGIDPGYRPGRQADPRLEFIVDFFDERYTHLTGDLVLTRHTLEHVPDVAAFTRHLRDSAAATPGTALFIEVPDVVRVLQEGAFWDIYHEHCSYFSLGSLGRMLRHVGLPASDLQAAFSDQYLLATARPDAEAVELAVEEPVDRVLDLAAAFAARVGAVVDHWRHVIGEAAAAGRRPVLWGGGSKAIAFVAALGLDDAISGVVDINPHKQGMFLAGSGLAVIAPDELRRIEPDLVVVMNPIYVDEITAMLGNLGLSPEVDAVT